MRKDLTMIFSRTRLCLVLGLLVLLPAIVAAQSQPPRSIPVTIASGASLSGAISLDGCTLGAIETPSAETVKWTTANITVLMSHDGGSTFTPVFDQFSEIVISVPTAAATQAVTITLPLGDVWTGRLIKFRSGTLTTPVIQPTTRNFKAICR
jgi:hypothetical protein